MWPERPSTAERGKLAAAQAELMQSLLHRATAPAGFEAERVQAAAEALIRKRQRAMAHAWPGLAAALGNQFQRQFESYASTHPLPADGDALVDGRRFARALADAGALPAAVALDVLIFDLRYRIKDGRLTERRGGSIRVKLIRRPTRLIFGWRWFRDRPRWFQFSLRWVDSFSRAFR